MQIKAQTILTELEAETVRAAEERSVGELRLPVRINGQAVGCGTLRRDGSMDIVLDESPAGLALREQLLYGSGDGISIGVTTHNIGPFPVPGISSVNNIHKKGL